MVAKMSLQRAFLFLVASALIFHLAEPTTFNVGSPGGSWNTNTNLRSWASNQTFVVGDNLIFQYTLDHTVLEVTEANYDSCLATSPIQAYMGGTTSIPLLLAGKRFFICGTSGHCGQGMKLEVDTVAATTPITPPAGIPPLPNAPPVALPPLPLTPPVALPPTPPAALPPLPLTPPAAFPPLPLTPPGIPSLRPPPAVNASAPPPGNTTAPPGSANVTSPPPSSSADKVMSKIFGVGFVSLMLLVL